MGLYETLYSKHNFEEIKIEKVFRPTLFKDMLSFSGWNVFGTLGQMLKDQGVNLILNFFFGPVVFRCCTHATLFEWFKNR